MIVLMISHRQARAQSSLHRSTNQNVEVLSVGCNSRTRGSLFRKKKIVTKPTARHRMLASTASYRKKVSDQPHCLTSNATASRCARERHGPWTPKRESSTLPGWKMPPCKSPGSLQTCQTTDIMLRGRKYTFSTLEFGKRKTRMRNTFGPCRTRFAEHLLGGRGRCAIDVLVLRKLPEPPHTFSAKVFRSRVPHQKNVLRKLLHFLCGADKFCRTPEHFWGFREQLWGFAEACGAVRNQTGFCKSPRPPNKFAANRPCA